MRKAVPKSHKLAERSRQIIRRAAPVTFILPSLVTQLVHHQSATGLRLVSPFHTRRCRYLASSNTTCSASAAPPTRPNTIGDACKLAAIWLSPRLHSLHIASVFSPIRVVPFSGPLRFRRTSTPNTVSHESLTLSAFFRVPLSHSFLSSTLAFAPSEVPESEPHLRIKTRCLPRTAPLVHLLTRKPANSKQNRLLHLVTSFKMIDRELKVYNMGRGAYDTTGISKPPPRPQPR